MTNNEIVKALDCCSKMHDCRECVFWEMHSAQCVSELLSNTLDLINSQKAEIERLKEAYAVYEETTGLKWARAEAIKEFAERLKMLKCHYSVTEYTFDFDVVTVEDIDNLVKEMTEEEGK
jgi:septation ring formation regulator EzrA